MITCKLGEKTYSVDFVTGRALREIEPAAKMYAKMNVLAKKAENDEELTEYEKNISTAVAMDTMVRWFCILFQNQFTPADVYDNYPVDRLMHDVAWALLAVQAQTTDVLKEFPTPPTASPEANP